MNHAEVRSKMADYLEGDLDLTQRALLDAHLDGCGRCSGEFADMRGTIALLRGLPDPEPPPFLVESVMRRIREGEGRRSLADRLRDFAASLVAPPVAIPATALTLGLLMATGLVDPANLKLPGLGPEPGGEPIVVPQRLALEPVDFAARGALPPAVARAPRIRIALPPRGQSLADLASNGFAPSRGLVGWSPRSMRTNVASNPLSLSVSNPVVGVDAGARSASAFEARPFVMVGGSLDDRLSLMIERPALFSAEFASLSIPEQERWLRDLAGYAHEQGRAQEALAALRGVTDIGARQVSTAFAAELRRLQNANVAALERRAAGER